MRRILDASVLISILLGEPGAAEASAMGATGSVTAVNLAEVRDRMIRRTGDRARVVRSIEALQERGLQVIACDRELGEQAADVRAAFYDRRRSPVSLADCWAIAAAMRLGGGIVSSDGDLLRVAKQVGVEVLAIPNSLGVRPQV